MKLGIGVGYSGADMRLPIEKVLRAERDPIRLQFLGRYLPTFKRLRDSLAASMKATGSPA